MDTDACLPYRLKALSELERHQQWSIARKVHRRIQKISEFTFVILPP
jgi:hypothetical protein